MRLAVCIFALFYLAGALLSGCAGPVAIASLDGTDWQLVEMNGARLPLHILLTLRFEDGKAGGAGPCNGYGAEYTQDGTKLTFGEVAGTLIYCEGVMEFETSYLEALNAVRSFRQEGDLLRMLDQSGAATLVLGKPEAAVLDRSSWKVAIVGEAAVPAGAEVTMGFAGGRITGKAGCNSYFASYTQEGGGLTIGGAGSTEMYCGEEGVMELERAFLGGLERIRRFEMRMGGLALLDEAGAQVLLLKP